MTSGALFFAMMLGVAGSWGIFMATSLLRSRFLRKPPNDDSLGGTLVKTLEDDSTEALTATFRRVFTLRLWALLFCLVSLVAWILWAEWMICVLPAGLGCGFLYLAHRCRTKYVLRITQQR